MRCDVTSTSYVAVRGTKIGVSARTRPERIDPARNTGVGCSHDRNTILDRTERQMREVLVRRVASLEPRIVRDVQQNRSSLLRVVARQLRKNRFVADEYAGRAERKMKRFFTGSTPKAAKIVDALKPIGIEERYALHYRNEEMLAIRRLRTDVTARIGEQRGVVVRERKNSRIARVHEADNHRRWMFSDRGT